MADTSEPTNIVKLLQQATPVVVSPLNQNKIADYFFGNYEGKRIQFGRVQAGELVGDIDSMEDEFKRYYYSADETNQIIEGLISPVRLFMKQHSAKVSDHSNPKFVSTRDLGGKIFCYPVQPSGFIEHGHSFSTARMSELYAWIYRLDKVGISTFFTNNWEETARFLTTVYNNEQKPPEDHTTLQRVYRPRITIKEADSFTKSLLFLSSAYKLGIGEVKAKAPADRFCSIFDLVTAPIDEIAETAGIGRKKAEQIIVALGREV